MLAQRPNKTDWMFPFLNDFIDLIHQCNLSVCLGQSLQSGCRQFYAVERLGVRVWPQSFRTSVYLYLYTFQRRALMGWKWVHLSLSDAFSILTDRFYNRLNFLELMDRFQSLYNQQGQENQGDVFTSWVAAFAVSSTQTVSKEFINKPREKISHLCLCGCCSKTSCTKLL